MERPDCIKHYTEIQEADDATYPGSEEKLSIGAPFGKTFGFERLGIHYELLLPGRRTSYPHAESKEEEFVYVIEGTPEVWIDGHVHKLFPGDGVGFRPGTGVCHTFLNNSHYPAKLLVVGDKSGALPDNQVFYPLNPERREQVGDQWWEDCPRKALGPHPGTPEPTT